MTQSKKLSKHSMVHMYAVIRQAELSIDAALGASWEDLLSYYEGKRLQAVLQIIEHLGGHLSHPDTNDLDAVPFQSRLRRRLTGFIHRWASFVPLSEEQLSFLYSCLSTIPGLLSRQVRPKTQEIVNVRMKLTECEMLIEDLLKGESSIQKAEDVEHFLNSSHFRHCSVDEISS